MISLASSTPVLRVATRTDTGLRRAQNEDWFLAADPCYLVADGMGGYDAGSEAARTAIAAFSEEFTAPAPATLERIEAALERARRDVARLAAGTERGAGCTLTGVIRIVHAGVPTWYVLNIGDSRVYLLREGRLQQLTRDHSLHSELLGVGSTSAHLAPRNVITRALGSTDTRHDAWLLPIEAGTRLLICSDGLTTEVDDEQLRAELGAGGAPEAVGDALLQRALEAGGRDNITLIVADVVSGGVSQDPAAPAGAHPDASADGTGDGGPDDDTIERTRPVRDRSAGHAR